MQGHGGGIRVAVFQYQQHQRARNSVVASVNHSRLDVSAHSLTLLPAQHVVASHALAQQTTPLTLSQRLARSCLQESIRGCDVFLVQPTCPAVNDNLMELLVTIDACRRASARSITAVLPYYGYARADRKTQVRLAQGGPTLSLQASCGW